jgi:hypothetical protein
MSITKFIGPSILLLRGWSSEPKQSCGDMTLPRIFQVLSMATIEVTDESGTNYGIGG